MIIIDIILIVLILIIATYFTYLFEKYIVKNLFGEKATGIYYIKKFWNLIKR